MGHKVHGSSTASTAAMNANRLPSATLDHGHRTSDRSNRHRQAVPSKAEFNGHLEDLSSNKCIASSNKKLLETIEASSSFFAPSSKARSP